MSRIILILIIIFLLTNHTIGQVKEDKFFYMTSTGYSNHPKCIADKWRDGKTALNTPIREGVVAINVDLIDGEWVVKSPLELGQKIRIEGMGDYICEDTGYFSDINFKQDYWTVDIYMESYEEAVEYGRQLRKVYVLND